jgi:hypothetical protein
MPADYDVLANGVVVGRVMKANAAPVGSPWTWTLAVGQRGDRTPRHGYAATREAAMPAFVKSWCCVTGRQLRRPDKTSREVDLKRTKILVSCNPFKGIICNDISEFESYMPSHAVRSPSYMPSHAVRSP